jgi:MarC family membrane protein
VSILSAAVLLFVVMDPLGNIPMFLVALRDVDESRRRYVVLRELGIAFAILVLFLIAGQHVLHIFHISEPSLSIAGGIILFLIALRMIFRGEEGVFAERLEREPLVVPLAVPYVAGPSSMATVMLLVTREPERWLDWLAALCGAWLTTAAILYSAAGLSRLLGQRGLVAVERLMGMLLTAVAVQMFLNGIAAFLTTLQKSGPVLRTISDLGAPTWPHACRVLGAAS